MFRGKTLVLELSGDRYSYKDIHSVKRAIKPADMRAHLQAELKTANTRANELAEALGLLEAAEEQREVSKVAPKRYPMGHSGVSPEDKKRGPY